MKMFTGMKKAPTMILAGFLTVMMPALVFNTVNVSPAMAQLDIDNDSDDDDDNDFNRTVPARGIDTGAGGTAVNQADSALPIGVAGGLALVGAGAVAYNRRKKN